MNVRVNCSPTPFISAFRIGTDWHGNIKTTSILQKNSPRIGKDGFSLRVGIRTSDTELGGISVRPAVNLDLYKKFGITFSIKGRGPREIGVRD